MLVKSFTSTVGLWSLLVVGSQAVSDRPSLISAILAAGPLIVVPLGLPLVRLRGATAQPLLTAAARFTLPSAALAGISLALPNGGLSASLALPWLAVAALAATAGAVSVLTEHSLRPDVLLPAAACGSILVGAVWLVISRMDAHPLGLSSEIVEMTAVHFHYAGFGAVVFAHQLRARCAGTARAFADAAGLGVVVAPAIVATGFVAEPLLGLAGAVLYAAALPAITTLTFHRLRVIEPRAARILLGVSVAPLPLTIAMGVAWAAGNALGTPAPSIPLMAATHGVANAGAFVCCGLAGWRLAERAHP